MKKLLLSIIALTFLAGASILILITYASNLGKLRLINDTTFTVVKGESPTNIVNRLVGKQNNLRIKIYFMLHPELSNIKVATYDLAGLRNLEESLKLLVTGKGINSQVRLIPGKTWKEYKSTFDSFKNVQDDLNDLNDKEIINLLGIKPIQGDDKFSNLEGYFAPNTYNIDYNGKLSTALKLAYNDLQKNLATAWQARNKLSKAKSPYELLIIASIIEKEKGNNEEANLISSVIANRLTKGMKLQVDPTVIYGIGDKYNGNITRKDLDTPTAYNTYVINGLPPTPITNVSLNSLMAAAQPADTNYLYFMAVYGESRHAFSATYNQHLQYQDEYVKQYRSAQKK